MKISYYNKYNVEVIDMMIRIFGRKQTADFCEINAFKYRMRLGLKDDMQIDFEKEQWYIDKAKELSGTIELVSEQEIDASIFLSNEVEAMSVENHDLNKHIDFLNQDVSRIEHEAIKAQTIIKDRDKEIKRLINEINRIEAHFKDTLKNIMPEIPPISEYCDIGISKVITPNIIINKFKEIILLGPTTILEIHNALINNVIKDFLMKNLISKNLPPSVKPDMRNSDDMDIVILQDGWHIINESIRYLHGGGRITQYLSGQEYMIQLGSRDTWNTGQAVITAVN